MGIMRRRLRALRLAIAPTGPRAPGGATAQDPGLQASPTANHPTAPGLAPVSLPPGSLRETASVAEENACAGARGGVGDFR
eukprot:COSAG04_NODE_15839_length_518_cov_14.276850_2_plen_81_part_00